MVNKTFFYKEQINKSIFIGKLIWNQWNNVFLNWKIFLK